MLSVQRRHFSTIGLRIQERGRHETDFVKALQGTAGCNRACRVAVFPVHIEFAGCRRTARAAGRGGQLRDDSMLDPELGRQFANGLLLSRGGHIAGKLTFCLEEKNGGTSNPRR